MSTESGPGCCIHGPLSGIGGIRTTTGRLACRCSSAHTLQKRGEHSPCKPYSRGRAQQSSQRFVLGVGLASTSSFSSSPTYPAIDACRPWFGVTTPCTVSMRTGTAVAVGCSSFRVGASAVEHGALLRLGSERDWSGVRCREGGCICRPRSMLGTVTVVSPCAYHGGGHSSNGTCRLPSGTASFAITAATVCGNPFRSTRFQKIQCFSDFSFAATALARDVQLRVGLSIQTAARNCRLPDSTRIQKHGMLSM